MIVGLVVLLLFVVFVLINIEMLVMVLFCEWKVVFDRVEDFVIDGWLQVCINVEVDGINCILDWMIGVFSCDGWDVCVKLIVFICDGECFLDDDGWLLCLILVDV